MRILSQILFEINEINIRLIFLNVWKENYLKINAETQNVVTETKVGPN